MSAPTRIKPALLSSKAQISIGHISSPFVRTRTECEPSGAAVICSSAVLFVAGGAEGSISSA